MTPEEIIKEAWKELWNISGNSASRIDAALRLAEQLLKESIKARAKVEELEKTLNAEWDLRELRIKELGQLKTRYEIQKNAADHFQKRLDGAVKGMIYHFREEPFKAIDVTCIEPYDVKLLIDNPKDHFKREAVLILPQIEESP